LGIDGAAVHLKGRGDFVSMFVLEMPPAPRPRGSIMFEEVLYGGAIGASLVIKKKLLNILRAG